MTQSFDRIKLEPTSSALGAEVSGVDLARIDDATFDEIYRAWLEYEVLFFREQRLTPDQQTALAARFGELDVYPFMEPLPGHPYVIPIIKEAATRSNFGGGWHSDMSYSERPAKATLLYAIEVPARGGDTLFASMTAAYEALSSGMQDLLSGVRAVFSASKVHGESGYYKDADHPMKMRANPTQQQARVVHPVIRTHVETGKKSIYLDAPHVDRFENMRTSESQPLMDYLSSFATSPQFTTRFRWRQGSLAVWDNRSVQHYALNDYAGQRREMHRVTTKGEVPV